MSQPTEPKKLLDNGNLARIVPRLPPETLHQVIRSQGLDACGELLTSATPAQLTAILDIDLWRQPQTGREEQFDVDRFGEWLEVLVDGGESSAAGVIAALDTHVVIAGLSRYVRIFDPGTFEPTESSDDERDRHEMMQSETGAAALECEVGGYLVRARRTDAWDAIVALLTTLDAEHDEFFHAVMQGCRRLSNSTPEADGLDELATVPEQHLLDVAVVREHRRSLRGYVTPSDARAFLRMARQSTHSSIVFSPWSDPEPVGEPDSPDGDPAPITRRPDSEAVEAVLDELTKAGVTRERRALPGAAGGDESATARIPLLRRAMAFLLDHDESAYLTRGRELAFLANALQAGCSVQSRALTPEEATDAAACVCNLGLECWPSMADSVLVDHDLVAVFAVGWSVLYRDVSLFAADQLIATLADLGSIDADTERELRALERRLATARDAGTPWLARDAADVLATLDTTVWVSLLGLLDECPVLPAALVAVLERRTTPVSATEFEFISTNGQLGDIRVFMKALPGILSG